MKDKLAKAINKLSSAIGRAGDPPVAPACKCTVTQLNESKEAKFEADCVRRGGTVRRYDSCECTWDIFCNIRYECRTTPPDSPGTLSRGRLTLQGTCKKQNQIEP